MSDHYSKTKEYFHVSNLWRIIVTSVYSILLIFSLFFYIKFICDTSNPSPKDLGLNSLVLWSSFALIFVWLPWDRFKIRFTKIGQFEFETAISTQRKESDEQISALLERLEHIENTYVSDSKAHSSNSSNELNYDAVKHELIRQLKQLNLAISPTKLLFQIKQSDPQNKLLNLSNAKVRQALARMHSEGLVVTSISAKGNTLYKLTNE